MWDLIVSVPDHCLSFYFIIMSANNMCTCVYMVMKCTYYYSGGYKF